MKISQVRREAELIRQAWLTWGDNESFTLFLRGCGYKIPPLSSKLVAVGPHLVVKWGDECVDYETRQYARARPRKKRYLARTIAHAKGLLIQERLPVDHSWGRCNGDCIAKPIARQLRIMDWGNHGYRADGSLAFFDTDSMGSGWYAWRRRNQ